MYSISIVWIILMIIFIVIAKSEQRVAIKSSSGIKRRLSTIDRLKDPEAFSLIKSLKKSFSKSKKLNDIIEEEQVGEEDESQLEKPFCKNKPNVISLKKYSLVSSDSKFHFTYDYENGKLHLTFVTKYKALFNTFISNRNR